MTARRQLLAVLALLASTVSALTAVRQEVTLAYRWAKGETVLYRVTQQVTTTMSGVPGAGDLSFEQTMNQVLRSVPESIAADGTATLRQTVDSVRVEMRTPMGQMGF